MDTRKTPGQIAKLRSMSSSTISHAATRGAFPATLITNAMVHPYYLIDETDPLFLAWIAKRPPNGGGRKRKVQT
jgi:hypothetical protein